MIDRVCCNPAWASLFPNSIKHHLEYRTSNHIPLALKIGEELVWKAKRSARIYRFEETWLEDINCKHIVKNSWSSGNFDGSPQSLISKLNYCATHLSHWG